MEEFNNDFGSKSILTLAVTLCLFVGLVFIGVHEVGEISALSRDPDAASAIEHHGKAAKIFLWVVGALGVTMIVLFVCMTMMHAMVVVGKFCGNIAIIADELYEAAAEKKNDLP